MKEDEEEQSEEEEDEVPVELPEESLVSELDKLDDKELPFLLLFLLPFPLLPFQLLPFPLPCVSVTDGTHLRPGIWVARLVPLMKADEVTGGRLFQRVLTPSKLFEFEHDFFTLIERVQSE
jgi:hypothetical protein